MKNNKQQPKFQPPAMAAASAREQHPVFIAKPPAPPPKPTCSNCPCWHRETEQFKDQTCRKTIPERGSPMAGPQRSWVHTVGTDYCWEHPVLKARLEHIVQAEVRRMHANETAGGYPPLPGGMDAVR